VPARNKTKLTIPAIKVTQWLPEWEEVTFNSKALQSRPKPYFYILSVRSSNLKALTGVYRRSARPGEPRAKDPNVQRGHEEERSGIIREFVKYGFPWCEMGKANRQAQDAHLLRKPGWLPTAIIVNILKPGDERNGIQIGKNDVLRVTDENNNLAKLELPKDFTGPDWEPETIFPLEVVDGQHRLWAFEDFEPGGEFDLPVVAFHGLDRSWQAYLFWSVNITPKKINRSLGRLPECKRAYFAALREIGKAQGEPCRPVLSGDPGESESTPVRKKRGRLSNSFLAAICDIE